MPICEGRRVSRAVWAQASLAYYKGKNKKLHSQIKNISNAFADNMKKIQNSFSKKLLNL